MTRILETSELLTIYAPSTKRLHLYDYDGTLIPIVDNAARAILSDLHIILLKTLANHPHNTVWVISGRDQAFLQAQLGSLTNIGLVAEHGAFMRRPPSSEWENLATEADMSWKATVRQVMETFESHHPGSFIEEKRVATVLHYRNVEQQGPAEKDAIDCKKSLEKALENWDVEFMSGKCVLEARPTNVDKGQIVRRIVGEMEHTMGCSPDFVFCIGDDVTDEGKERLSSPFSRHTQSPTIVLQHHVLRGLYYRDRI